MNVQSVLDIAALKAISPSSLVNGETFIVDEPGRGGTFVWDPTATDADDDGRIFQASAGGIGRWFRQYNGANYLSWWAKLDNVTDGYAQWVKAIASLDNGDELLIDGPLYYATPIVLTKSIDIICVGENAYFRPDTPGAEAFTFNPAGLRKVKWDVAMYGPLASCRNGFVFDAVTESDFRVSAIVGATSYGVQALGCLNCRFDIDISTNRLDPYGNSSLPAKSIYLGASSNGVYKSCNVSLFKVYLGGGGAGIEGGDAGGEGDFAIEGTIEGNSGPALQFTGNTGLNLRNLHMESGVSSPSTLTNCQRVFVGPGVHNVGASASNTTLMLNGCLGFVIDGYTGSLDIDAASSGTVRSVQVNAYDVLRNASPVVQMVGPYRNTSNTMATYGELGEYNQENIFHNPFIDIWSNGIAAEPDGFAGGGGGVTVTWAQEQVGTFPGVPGGTRQRAAYVTLSGTPPTALQGVVAAPIDAFAFSREDTWYAFMAAVMVQSGQPNVSVYMSDGSSVLSIGDVDDTGTYTVIRGAMKIGAGSTPLICFTNTGGSFLIGGLSIVKGANPPRHISNHGKREAYVVSSISSAPTFVGQHAVVPGSPTPTGYIAVGTSSSDWLKITP